MPLSDTAIRATKPKLKPFKLSDGGGLHLLVQPNGAKLWRLAYRFAGKQKLISFGRYPIIWSLSDNLARRRPRETRLSEVISRAYGLNNRAPASS